MRVRTGLTRPAGAAAAPARGGCGSRASARPARVRPPRSPAGRGRRRPAREPVPGRGPGPVLRRGPAVSASRRASATVMPGPPRRMSRSTVRGSGLPSRLWNCRPRARSRTQGATSGSSRRSASSTPTTAGPRMACSASLQIPAIASPVRSSTGPSAAGAPRRAARRRRAAPGGPGPCRAAGQRLRHAVPSLPDQAWLPVRLITNPAFPALGPCAVPACLPVQACNC